MSTFTASDLPPATTPTLAEAALAENLDAAIARAKAITALLTLRKRYATRNATHWGHVGDAARAAADLLPILQYLTGETL